MNRLEPVFPTLVLVAMATLVCIQPSGSTAAALAFAAALWGFAWAWSQTEATDRRQAEMDHAAKAAALPSAAKLEQLERGHEALQKKVDSIQAKVGLRSIGG